MRSIAYMYSSVHKLLGCYKPNSATHCYCTLIGLKTEWSYAMQGDKENVKMFWQRRTKAWDLNLVHFH